MTTTQRTSTSAVETLRAEYERLWRAGWEQPWAGQIDQRTLKTIESDFFTLAHRHQEAPTAARNGRPWTTWLILGGRGAGKTRTGAEWVRAQVHGTPPYADRRHGRIALVGETEQDARAVMIEGVSGLLATAPRAERPAWISSRRLLLWPNGAVGQVFSAEDPDSLRGPQFDAAWCDELAKWRHADYAFNMLKLGLRIGERPRALITTTPRPIPLIKRLLADKHTAVTRAGTQANAAFLSRAFLDEVDARYGGTRLGRQEIDGELIEDRPDALWSRATIERSRVAAAPELARIVIGIDPPSGSGTCGIVAAGRSEAGTVYVLGDASVTGLSPLGWAERAVALYRRLKADTLVVEVNQGGDMVGDVLRQVDRAVPVKDVRATRGKHTRAEPVSAMYEQEKVKHVDPPMQELEDQMCDFGRNGLSAGGSPDRLDALVLAVTELTEPVRSSGVTFLLGFGPRAPLVPWEKLGLKPHPFGIAQHPVRSPPAAAAGEDPSQGDDHR